MARRVVPLTGDLVEELPAPCATCLHWELGAPPPDPRGARGIGDGQPSDPVVRKQAWVSARVQEGTPPGRVVRIDEEVVAHVLFGPPQAFARRPLAPRVSDDALLLATLWVQPEWRRHGLGRLLLQAALKEAHRLDIAAVEVYGDRRWRERACLLPATWLLHEGFEVHDEHPRTPLLRLELRRTVRWAESLEHALEEVLGRLPGRRVVLPEPVAQRTPASERNAAGGPG